MLASVETLGKAVYMPSSARNDHYCYKKMAMLLVILLRMNCYCSIT